MKKTKKILSVEAKIGEPMEIFLEREYHTRTMKDIARQISVSQSTLKSWAEGFGIPLRTPVIPPKEELLLKYQEKNSNQIAEEYGVTGRTIRNWMEKYRIARRVPTPLKEELSAKCETKTLTEIAGEYGVCLLTVKGWRRNYGITTTKRLSAKSGKKISEKKQKYFGARDGRKRNYSKTRQERTENNSTTENNGREYNPIGETTLECLINSYNSKFYKDKKKTMVEIFNEIKKRTGSERLVYMTLRNHYSKLERISV